MEKYLYDVRQNIDWTLVMAAILGLPLDTAFNV
jgi:hypothetical protein